MHTGSLTAAMHKPIHLQISGPSHPLPESCLQQLPAPGEKSCGLFTSPLSQQLSTNVSTANTGTVCVIIRVKRIVKLSHYLRPIYVHMQCHTGLVIKLSREITRDACLRFGGHGMTGNHILLKKECRAVHRH